MKKIIFVFCAVLCASLISAAELYARGGGGGGGGGRGGSRGGMQRGGEFGGGSAVRSRQLEEGRSSQAVRSGSDRQIRSGGGPAGAAYRAGSQNVHSFLNMPAGGGPPIAGRPGGPGHIDRGYVNRQFAHRYPDFHHHPFGPGWYGPHVPPRWHYWHYDRYRPGYWWGWATTGMITGWIVYDWPAPVYYVYGPGGNVYYEGASVYVNGQPTYSSEEYYNQASKIAAAPPLDEEKAKQIEWMPLGVFAVVQDAAKESNLALQLAVSKDGIISGTIFNETTKLTHTVEGAVDKKTQRAAWSFIEGENPKVIMETGIFNLSKDETNVLVHLTPTDTKIWTLIRLDKPAETASPAAETSSNVEIVDPNAAPTVAPPPVPAATGSESTAIEGK